MDELKAVTIVIVISLLVLGVAVGYSFLEYEPPNTDGGGGSSGTQIQKDTDLIDLSLEVPNWGLLMSDEEILELESLEGKFVVVDLMQTGECIPCQTQTGYLKDLYIEYEDSIEIISLSLVLSDTINRVASYKSDNDIDWKVGLDTSGVFGNYFNAQSVPTLIIIDSDGYFRWLHVGVWSNSDISSTISLLDR